MIELENINKTYRSKKNKVHALKNITITLPERGMTFIVGKSGSGKSTLLNILGGLDVPTSGDMLIDGVSVKSFKERDYDAYRNDYVGFIFQEYNLIDHLTVAENIELALNLQGKKNADAVCNVLARVDLADFGKRKISTLSGGQKQRVAIARSLIKKPKLLIADEPTGALDSETGKNLFKLLHELSKEILVVVVSHDMDFARKYGERIITLQDGEISSDTESDSFTTIITAGVTKLTQKKHGLRVSAVGKLAFRGIAKNPIRFCISLLLCAVSFIMLGISFISLQYDVYETMAYTLSKYDPEVVLHKTTRYSAQDAERFRKEYPGLEFSEIFGIDGANQQITIYNEASLEDSLYTSELQGDCTGISVIKRNGYELIAGRLPNTHEEIAISLGLYYGMTEHGNTKLGDTYICVEKYEDVLGKNLAMLPGITIVGIVDTKIDAKYDVLKKYTYQSLQALETEENSEYKRITKLSQEYSEVMRDSTHYCCFVLDDYLNTLSFFAPSYSDVYKIEYRMVYGTETMDYIAAFNALKKEDKANLYIKDAKTDLAENEILLAWQNLDLLSPGIYSKFLNETDIVIHSYAEENINRLYLDSAFRQKFDPNDEGVWRATVNYSAALSSGCDYYNENPYGKSGYDLEQMAREIVFDSVDIQILLKCKMPQGEKQYTKKVVGFFYECPASLKRVYPRNRYAVIADREILETYRIAQDSNINGLSVKLTDNDKSIRFCKNNALTENRNETEGCFRSFVANEVQIVDNEFHSFKGMGGFLGGILAAFAVLMLFNFISSNVNERKKEIGILKAMGASFWSICKIFILEAVCISLVTGALASVLSFIVVNRMNLVFLSKVITPITPLRIQAWYVPLLLAIGLVVSVLAVIIPLIKIKKLTPINTIKNE